MADVSRLLASADKWHKSFRQPLPLGASSRLSIVTCMDSRLIPERMFELEIGEAEVIRNAGGRITFDVIRSLTVAQEILKTRTIFVIHHTDCGGMHAVQRHDELIGIMAHHLGFILGTALRLLSLLGLDKLLLKPIHPTAEGLAQSVIDDVNILQKHPLIPKDIGIFGFVYSTEDGSLKEISKRLPETSQCVRHLP